MQELFPIGKMHCDFSTLLIFVVINDIFYQNIMNCLWIVLCQTQYGLAQHWQTASVTDVAFSHMHAHSLKLTGGSKPVCGMLVQIFRFVYLGPQTIWHICNILQTMNAPKDVSGVMP